MRVSFEVPDPLWFRLAHTDIPGLVVGALKRAAHDPEGFASVKTLHGQGKCDADIARELNMTPGAVATVRRGMGLPANRRYVKKEK
jgi:hypothetical protein